MQTAALKRAKQAWISEFGDSCVGRVVEITDAGVPHVDFPGNPSGPVQARSLIAVPPVASHDIITRPVLLAFEHGDLGRPVILGFVRDSIISNAPEMDRKVGDSLRPTEAKFDGRTIQFEAQEEILLTCGKSSILLRKDGKVIIKGAEIVSRSSGANKIRGGSVHIN